MITWCIQADIAHSRHCAEVAAINSASLQAAIDQAIDRMAERLDAICTDECLYLLIEWQGEQQQLILSLTDVSKVNDASESIQLHFTELPEGLNEDDIAYCCKHYLTICEPFLLYSLVAAFTASDRKSAVLL